MEIMNRMEKKIVVVVKGVISYTNKVLIVKRDKQNDIGAGTWECIGGKIDFGEELEQALLREVRKEVGLDILIEKLLYATTFKTDPSRQVVLLAYKCRAKSTDVILSEEHSEYLWVSKEELRKLLSKLIIDDMDKYNVFPETFND